MVNNFHMEFAEPFNELIFSTTQNHLGSRLPSFPFSVTNQYPMNMITSNAIFSKGLLPFFSRTYASSKYLQDIISAHHDRKYECKKCARTFVSEKRMQAHELKKHSANTTDFVNGKNAEQRKLFKCNQCSRTYETFYNFKEHLAKHKGKLFRCTICSKQLSGQSALSRHAKIHDKPYECIICTSRFSSAYDLDCHFSYYHSTIKRFKCFHCNRVLYNYSGKLRHERLCSSKNTIIKKVSHSPIKISGPEEIIEVEQDHQLVKKTNVYYECETIQNHSVSIDFTDESEFRMSKTVDENPEKLFPSYKSEQKKTFHICDIMHDIPGFS